jgi:Uma2 family endonuclease
VQREIGWQTRRSAATQINLSTRGQSEDADRPRFGFLIVDGVESKRKDDRMIASNSTITPEQLLAMPDSESLEIVRGKIVEKNADFESSELAARCAVILGAYLLKHRIGRITVTDGGFQCFPDDETKFRKPDLAVVSFARLPQSQRVGAYCKIAPDLAVEVLSPNDEAKEISDRVKDFLTAGTPLFWVVDEFLRQVIVYSSKDSPKIYCLGDTLSAEPVLPGFLCQVNEIFDGIPPSE